MDSSELSNSRKAVGTGNMNIIYDVNNMEVTQEDYDLLIHKIEYLRQMIELHLTVENILEEEIIKFTGHPVMISQSQLNQRMN